MSVREFKALTPTLFACIYFSPVSSPSLPLLPIPLPLLLPLSLPCEDTARHSHEQARKRAFPRTMSASTLASAFQLQDYGWVCKMFMTSGCSLAVKTQTEG